MATIGSFAINSDRRTYRLSLRSSSQVWNSRVAWRYPVTSPVNSQAPVAKAPSPAGDAVARLNFSYSIRGPRTPWRPLRVFDDGVRTYVEFAPTIVMTELPPLFRWGADGHASELINFRVAGQRIVVDGILDRAELRLGQGRSERRVRILRETAR